MGESLLKFGEKPSLDTMAFKSGKTPILSEAGSLDFVPVLGSLKISLSWLGVYTFPRLVFVIPWIDAAAMIGDALDVPLKLEVYRFVLNYPHFHFV